MDFAAGDHLTLSSIQSTVHLGAHADASSHFHAEGQPIAARPLSRYIGACQVIDVSKASSPRIGIKDLGVPLEAPRILLRTDSFPDPNQWTNDFQAIEPTLIDFLAEQEVTLVGIDTPSVDEATSKDLPTHARLFHHDMANLEGLWLKEVPAGIYGLIALPLKLEDTDASPVRAILVPEGILSA